MKRVVEEEEEEVVVEGVVEGQGREISTGLRALVDRFWSEPDCCGTVVGTILRVVESCETATCLEGGGGGGGGRGGGVGKGKGHTEDGIGDRRSEATAVGRFRLPREVACFGFCLWPPGRC